MVLSDYPGGGIEAGAKGTVSEVTAGNVQVTWDHKNGFGDGFAADELQFLALGTEMYPELQADTVSVILSDDEATALSCLEDATTEDLQALWEATQDRTEALLPYPSAFAADYLKRALKLLGITTAAVQETVTRQRPGYPRDVVITIGPAPRLCSPGPNQRRPDRRRRSAAASSARRE
jgi:hypothetical protein